MLTLFLLIFLTVGVSTINGYTCTCCFPGQPHTCQTPEIPLSSCANCTSVFCANHVKGCQSSTPCKVECKSGSSSISTSTKGSSSMSTINTIPNNTFTVGIGFIMISVALTLLVFVN
ncbi:unnamed protein product [Rotaria sordida]|uniref:Uncharacterized protein n=1 Tax=Rotaria sordida TaxID=392033 RepID=A0A813YKM2_9BILA|nr:unnamed protein product [Rotaria sordida]CAF0935783.1 unnamed protein product [Rotaria sordida]